MNTSRLLFHLTKADFLERTRRYSFLITLGLTLYAGYTFVPPAGANYKTVALADYRGLYNSAWIGSAVAMMGVTFLSLVGFYLVKNAVERDERTGVGQIIATTPLGNRFYLLGKMLSNFAVLAAMFGVLFLVALIMQLVRGEERQIDWWGLFSPFLLIAMPAMLMIAALAILFESISWLRGGLGNVVYYFLWTVLLVAIVLPGVEGGRQITAPPRIHDVFGITIPLASMREAAQVTFPDYDGSISLGYEIDVGDKGPARAQTFRWEGIGWTPALLGDRLLWVGVALGLVWLAGQFFNRFDSSPGKSRRLRKQKPEEMAPAQATAIDRSLSATHLTPLAGQAWKFRFMQRLLAELRLMLKRLPVWWYVVAAGLNLAGLLTPVPVARQWLLPFAWIWPILLWSHMGSRENHFNTGQLIFSSAYPLRQLPLTWLAGVLVAVLTGMGIAVRLILAGEGAGLSAWITGALFIPALALALGIWTGSSKFFEVIYVMVWYAGPINKVPVLDFMGTTEAAITTGMPAIFLVTTGVLMGLAVLGRLKQMRG